MGSERLGGTEIHFGLRKTHWMGGLCFDPDRETETKTEAENEMKYIADRRNKLTGKNETMKMK